jgi:hypothetical protein
MNFRKNNLLQNVIKLSKTNLQVSNLVFFRGSWKVHLQKVLQILRLNSNLSEPDLQKMQMQKEWVDVMNENTWLNGMTKLNEWVEWMSWMNELNEWVEWMSWMNELNEWAKWIRGIHERNEWEELMNGMTEWNGWVEWMSWTNELNEKKIMNLILKIEKN